MLQERKLCGSRRKREQAFVSVYRVNSASSEMFVVEK
jgi:hypothetical protein